MGKVLGTVAQLGFGFAGSLFGPAALAPLGFAIGNLIGGMLFGPKADVPQGSRLDDLKVQGSEYGIPIPLFYGGTIKNGTRGGVPTTGNIIDADPRGGIEEVATSKKVKVGGTAGKRKQSTTEYTYFITIAILFGEGPLKIDKFWADEKLLFDRYATLENRGWNMQEEEVTGAEMCEQARFYPGNFKQLPDTALEQFHDGDVPAYRGSCYGVIVKYPLADHNNRVPTFRALVSNGITEKREIIRRHLLRAGIPEKRIDLCEITGEVLGAFQTSQGGARDFVEKVMAHSLCELGEWDGKIKDIPKNRSTEWPVDEADLSAHLNGEDVPPRLTTQIHQDEELPSICNLRFLDFNNDFEPNIAVGLAQFEQADRHINELSLEMPIIDTLENLSPLAQIIIDEAIASRYPYDVSILPKYIRRVPGNTLLISSLTGVKRMRLSGMSIGTPGPISASGRSYNPRVFTDQRVQRGIHKPVTTVKVYDEPHVALFDVVALEDGTVKDKEIGVLVASSPAQRGDAFEGALVKFDAKDMDDEIVVDAPAVLGKTLTDLHAFPNMFIDSVSKIRVSLFYGELASMPFESLFEHRGNTAIIGEVVIRFLEAEEVEPGIFEISKILWGQKGSDYNGTMPQQSDFLLLVDENGNEELGYTWADTPKKNSGTTLKYKVAPFITDGKYGETYEFAFKANTLFSLQPGGINIELDEVAQIMKVTWLIRTRYETGDFWRSGENQASDPTAYKVVLFKPDAPDQFMTKLVNGEPVLEIPYAEAIALFGDTEGPFVVSVAVQGAPLSLLGAGQVDILQEAIGAFDIAEMTEQLGGNNWSRPRIEVISE